MKPSHLIILMHSSAFEVIFLLQKTVTVFHKYHKDLFSILWNYSILSCTNKVIELYSMKDYISRIIAWKVIWYHYYHYKTI